MILTLFLLFILFLLRIMFYLEASLMALQQRACGTPYPPHYYDIKLHRKSRKYHFKELQILFFADQWAQRSA